MNTGQVNKLKMYMAVQRFLELSLGLLTPLPNFAGAFNSFVASVADIQRIAGQESLNTHKITKSKQEIRKLLLEITEEIAHQLALFAQSSNDQVLSGESDFTGDDPKISSDLLLVNKAVSIYGLAVRHLSGLSHLHVYDDLLSDFKTTIDTFYAMMPKSALISGDSMINIRKLSDDFRNADESLQFIDAIINIIHLPESQFYTSYLKARNLLKSRPQPKVPGGRVFITKQRSQYGESPINPE